MLRSWTTFYITVFTFLILLQPILSIPAPPGLVEQDKNEGLKRTSYSGYFMESIMTPEDAARLGFEDMKKQHKGKGGKTEPSIMSSLQKEKEMYLASSLKGGFASSDNKDPTHVHPNVQKHLTKCENHHGGKHGTGANCGEVHAASNFFKKNPSQEHIEGAKFVAYGHPGGKKSSDPAIVDPCTGSGRHSWGCTQFLKSVTRPLHRPLTPLDRPFSPLPGSAGVGNASPGPSSPKKGDKPLEQKPSPLRTGAGQPAGEIQDSPPSRPPSPLSNANQADPQKNEDRPASGKVGSGQPAPSGRPTAPPKQRPGSDPQQPQYQKKRPEPLEPLQPSSSRSNSPSKDRVATMARLMEPIPNTKPFGQGSAPLRPQSNPKERPATPPPPPKKKEPLAPLPAGSIKLKFPETSKQPASPSGSGKSPPKTASSPPKDRLPPHPPPPSQPPKKADQNQKQKQPAPPPPPPQQKTPPQKQQSASLPPQSKPPPQKQQPAPPPAQKQKQPAPSPPRKQAQLPATPPPPQQTNPAPPPILKPANSPPPSARPASSGGGAQSAAKGGKGKGKRDVGVMQRRGGVGIEVWRRVLGREVAKEMVRTEMGRGVLRREIIRRAGTVEKAWEGDGVV